MTDVSITYTLLPESDGAMAERVLVKTSLGLAWREWLASNTVEPVCFECGDEFGIDSYEKRSYCLGCDATAKLPEVELRRWTYAPSLLFRWVEAMTDPLTPVVLTPALYSGIEQFRKDAWARRSSVKLLKNEKQAREELARLCELHSGTVV